MRLLKMGSHKKYGGCWLTPSLILSEDFLQQTDTFVYFDIHPLSPVLVLQKKKRIYQKSCDELTDCMNLTC